METNHKDREYWDKHAKNYDRSMSLLGRPMPRMVELACEATRGLGSVLEVAAGTGLVTCVPVRQIPLSSA
jgi:ubiquinone/menaquinone biosynthesis C-methylase UbiE